MPRAVIYISEFQNKLAWKFDISVSVNKLTPPVFLLQKKGEKGGKKYHLRTARLEACTTQKTAKNATEFTLHSTYTSTSISGIFSVSSSPPPPSPPPLPPPPPRCPMQGQDQEPQDETPWLHFGLPWPLPPSPFIARLPAHNY